MMNDFKDWLINSLPSLVPYHNSKIISGTREFSIHISCIPGSDNLLNLFLRSLHNKNESVEENIRFSISGKVPDLHFVKRLRRTPFFVSSLVNDDYSLYILDFYEWSPDVKIYRILYFQSILTNDHIEISLPENHKQLGPGKYEIGKYFLSILSHTTENVSGSILKIPVNNIENIENVFVFSFSMKEETSQNQSLEVILRKLNFLISTAENNHILNDTMIQNVKKELRIDELWCSQKGYYPDRQINKSLITNSLSESTDLLWTMELAHYMGWHSITSINSLNISHPLFKNYKKDFQPFYDAYFSKNFDADKIIDSLQLWWNQYSLPLYELIFKRDYDTSPSLFFIIYSLALQVKLPWGLDLYYRCGCFQKEPQMALLAYLIQLVIFGDDEDQTIQIAPGPESAGNVKGFKRGETEYRYSQFGRVHFTSLSQDRIQHLKIDKEVILNHNIAQNLIKILPNIMPVELDRFRANYISIEIDKNYYQIPLIWKKAELTISGCRIRWIFKKDRFQFTCQTKKTVSTLKIDGRVINLNKSQKVIYYHPLIKSKRNTILNLFDMSGRSYFLHHELLKSKAQIVGWIQDQYGLLMEDLNIRQNSQLTHYKGQESGMIHLSFPISQNLDSIQILTRKTVNKILIQKIDNKVCQKLMGYSHQGSKSLWLMIVNDQINAQKNDIQNVLIEYLGFLPLVLYKSEVKKKLAREYLIILDNANDLYKIEKNNNYSKSITLSINYPEGIRKLYSILSGHREN